MWDYNDAISDFNAALMGFKYCKYVLLTQTKWRWHHSRLNAESFWKNVSLKTLFREEVHGRNCSSILSCYCTQTGVIMLDIVQHKTPVIAFQKNFDMGFVSNSKNCTEGHQRQENNVNSVQNSSQLRDRRMFMILFLKIQNWSALAVAVVSKGTSASAVPLFCQSTRENAAFVC